MHGLSTLNRLLGKKNKEVSRSTSNLSKSHSNLDSSSQHNKISPILNNAPFEQTFRVTVYLPKNQLYVERIGAKTKLSRLMCDVCDSKNLTYDKYEFRHPTDMSQVFDNEKTIGEVGFNELRLVLKTESRYNGDFHRYHSNSEDMIKYRSSNVPESVSSSSEISRSNLKNVSKTSPYSSTNSLNSLDSTGMSTTNKIQPPVAPIRKKKRMAPRPPSENSIPEQEIFSTSTLNVFKEPHSILPRKNFHVSSPQLYNNNNNNNNNNNFNEIAQKSDSNNNNTELRSISNRLNAITRPTSLYTSADIVKNLPERQRNNSESSEIQSILKESSSKQNSLERPKKKSPAPAPPSRKYKPTPSPRTIQEDSQEQSITEIKEVDECESVIAQNNLHNANNKIEDISKGDGNVSKVLLNKFNDPSKSNIETDGPISIQIISSEIAIEQQQQQPQETESKLPVVSKVHISHPDDETRSASEEEEMTVNIYNVTKSVVTCEKAATIIKETTMTATTKKVSVVEEKKHVVVENNNVVKEETKTVIQEEHQRSPSPEWTYTLPPPVVLSDTVSINNVINNNCSPTDRHKSVGDSKFFSDYTSTTVDNETILSDSNTTVISAETHIQPIINDRRKALDDSFIINSTDYTKPSPTLPPPLIADNQSDKSAEIITSDLEDGYLGNNNNKNNQVDDNKENELSVEVVVTPVPATVVVETNRMDKEMIFEDFQRSRLIITRSDSFHSIGQQKKGEYELTTKRARNLNALPQRSTSFLSLVHSQRAEMSSNKLSSENVPYNRQKSTSELSISDVPSLQSLEVIKNILNSSSRKSSLPENSSSSNSNSNSRSFNANGAEDTSATIKNISSTPIKANVAVESAEKIYTVEKRDAKKLETQKSEPVGVVVVERMNNNNNNNNNNKKTETQWRYSGPPKINFSTWSERPKAEVAVMSDDDYIFGGVSATTSTTLPRNVNNSQRIDSQVPSAEPSSFVKKTHTVVIKNEINNNKEAERHLPKVLGVEYKKDVNPVILRNSADILSSSEIINRNSSSNSGNSKTIITFKERPTSTNASNYQNSSTQFVSYNRLTGNHKKFTPIVHGFAKLDNISETQSDVKSLPIANKITDVSEKKAEAPIVPKKPSSYLRSTSAGDINRNVKLTPVTNSNDNNNNNNNSNKYNIDQSDGAYEESPFSQTLRRTGLIEKMLTDDKRTESIFGRVIDKPKKSSDDSFNSIGNNSNNNNNAINRVNEEEAKYEKVTIARQFSQPIVPQPPPAPAMMTFRKSVPAGEINSMDARSQLLDAIKNFNKDSLRRK